MAMSDVQRHVETSRQKRYGRELAALFLDQCDELSPVAAKEMLKAMRESLLVEEVEKGTT